MTFCFFIAAIGNYLMCYFGMARELKARVEELEHDLKRITNIDRKKNIVVRSLQIKNAHGESEVKTFFQNKLEIYINIDMVKTIELKTYHQEWHSEKPYKVKSKEKRRK